MKLRVIQENNIVVVTLLSFSDEFKKRFRERRGNQLVNEYDENYFGIYLYGKKREEDSTIGFFENELRFYINDVKKTGYYRAPNRIHAERIVEKIKNSVNLINHGTEVEIEDTKILILE